MRIWIDRVRRMTLADYAIALEALAVAVWIEIALRVMPFSRLVDRLGRRSFTSGSLTTPMRLSRFVAVAYDVLPLPDTCLRRSLVTYRLLRRRGVASRIGFGVAKNGSLLDAHAWVVCGAALPGEMTPRFAELTPPAEELPDVVNQQLRFLERREVSSAGHVG